MIRKNKKEDISQTYVKDSSKKRRRRSSDIRNQIALTLGWGDSLFQLTLFFPECPPSDILNLYQLYNIYIQTVRSKLQSYYKVQSRLNSPVTMGDHVTIQSLVSTYIHTVVEEVFWYHALVYKSGNTTL